MDKKALFVNFVVTFIAAFLAIALFMHMNRPPQMMQPGQFPPPPPQQGQTQPMPQQEPQAQMPAQGPEQGMAPGATNRMPGKPERGHGPEQNHQEPMPARK